jgi:hypothetical protein
MQEWLFERGKWIEITSPLPQADNLQDAVRAAHYDGRPSARFGREVGFTIEYYVADTDAAPYPFLVVVEDLNRAWPVFVSDFPSLVQLLNALIPVVRFDLESQREEDRRTADHEKPWRSR